MRTATTPSATRTDPTSMRWLGTRPLTQRGSLLRNDRNCSGDSLIKKCRRWGLNPRPFGIEPKSTALDHSATSTF